MNRRGFLATGVVGLFPWQQRRQRRQRRQRMTPANTLTVIRFATRDKVANTKELFANSPWRGKEDGKYTKVLSTFNGKPTTTRVPNGEGLNRAAVAYLPKDRALLIYHEGKPKIWYGKVVVAQYYYPSANFLSQVLIYCMKQSTMEDFPSDNESPPAFGHEQAVNWPDEDISFPAIIDVSGKYHSSQS